MQLSLLLISTVLAAASAVPIARAGDPPAVLRLEPKPAARFESPRGAETRGRLSPKEFASALEILGASDPSTIPAPWRDAKDGGVVFRAEKSVHVILRHAIGAKDVQRILIRAACDQELGVRAVFHARGAEVASSSRFARLAPSGRPDRDSEVLIDLPQTLRVEGDTDALELVFFVDVPAIVVLRSFEFQRVPLAAWYPEIGGEVRPCTVGLVSEPSIAIASNVPLAAELDVPAHSTLDLAVGVPAELSMPGDHPNLRVTVRADGVRDEVRELDVPEDSSAAAHWIRSRVDLERFAGRRASLAFELSTRDRNRPTFAALSLPCVRVAREHAPTVLFVTSDTHRADHFNLLEPALGIHTPTLDALARRGVCFDDCWSAANVTNPSHVAMLTGLSPRDTRLVDNFTAIDARAETLAERFRSRGWLTLAALSAHHLGDETSGLGRGFDWMNAPRQLRREGHETVDALLAELDRRPDVPTFVWLHLFDAHVPYDPPEEFLSLYWPKERNAFDTSLPEPIVPDDALAFTPKGLRDLDYLRARYKGGVTTFDDALARALDHPRLARAITLVTGDHGESLGEHQVYWNHAGLYPQTLHVPLIIATPSGPRGERVATRVTNLDAGRTLLDLAGLQDAQFPGRNLLELAHSPPRARPRFSFGAHAFEASVEEDGWLVTLALEPYSVWIDRGCAEPSVLHATQLFDLHRDPLCADDVSAVERARTKELRWLLVRWLALARREGLTRTGAPAAAARDAETASRMAALGYGATSAATPDRWIDPDCACAICASWR